jgi:hypothetical protein
MPEIFYRKPEGIRTLEVLVVDRNVTLNCILYVMMGSCVLYLCGSGYEHGCFVNTLTKLQIA